MSPLAGASISIPTTTGILWSLSPFLLDLSVRNDTAIGIFAAVGLFFPAAVTLLNFESNRRMGPTAASTISSTAPLFSVAGALIFLHETLTWPVTAGISAIVTGVMILSWSSKGYSRSWPLWAIIIPIAGATFRGLAQTTIKLGLDLWHNAFAAALIGYTVSAVVILLFVFSYGSTKSSIYSIQAVSRFVLAGILNGFGLLLSYEAFSRGQVMIVAPILGAFPVFTFFLSALFLRDERINVRTALDVLSTVVGVALMTAR